MPNQSNTLDEAQLEIRDIINELEEKGADGDYIYRGEPEHYNETPYFGKISSNLYRQYAEIEVDGFDIEIVQEEILTEAEAYSHEKSKDWIAKPRNPRHRVIAQKSIFVRHPKGFFEPEDLTIVNVPTYLKLSLMEHLRKYHGISTNVIYNDLHGFITNQSIHESAYTEFHRGLSYYIKGDESENPAEKHEAYQRAIQHYTKALELKPDIPEGYNSRGNAYRDKGEIQKAIEDYNMAIESDPQDAVPYNNRGVAYLNDSKFDKAVRDFSKSIECDPEDANAYNNLGVAYFEKGDIDMAIKEYTTAIELHPEYADAFRNRGTAWLLLKEWEKVQEDLTIALEMGLDIVVLFHRTYVGITNFEQKNDIDLPDDIKEILTTKDN